MTTPDHEFRVRLSLALAAVIQEAGRRRRRLRFDFAAGLAALVVVIALPAIMPSLTWVAAPAVVLLASWIADRRSAAHAWMDAFGVIHRAAGEPTITPADREETR